MGLCPPRSCAPATSKVTNVADVQYMAAASGVHGEDLNAETHDKEYGAAMQHHAVNRVVPGAA